MCGVVAGPMFVAAFTVIGAARAGYDWRSLPVSSLAIGRQGWTQRANFIVAGVLYTSAARALGRCPRRTVGPRAVPALVAGVGLGLIGSGVFVTDPVGGFPAEPSDEERLQDADAVGTASTREGRLHNLSAIPIFAGIPVAALAGAASALPRQGLPLGRLLAGLERGHGRQLRALRPGVGWRATSGRQGRGVPAPLDRDRVRLDCRAVASCVRGRVAEMASLRERAHVAGEPEAVPADVDLPLIIPCLDVRCIHSTPGATLRWRWPTHRR